VRTSSRPRRVRQGFLVDSVLAISGSIVGLGKKGAASQGTAEFHPVLPADATAKANGRIGRTRCCVRGEDDRLRNDDEKPLATGLSSVDALRES